MSDEKKFLTDHDYDGIQEFDYQLPKWWLNLFYVSILFALGYWSYYTFFEGRSIQQVYDAEEARYEQLIAASNAKAGNVTEADLLAYVKNPAKVRAGHDIFQSHCIACHGDHAQGIIGPNLTDDYWLHGGKLVEIAHTITHGVPEKGMPPWGPVLSTEQIHSVVAFIRSIHGTHPAGAKAPQGVKVEEQ